MPLSSKDLITYSIPAGFIFCIGLVLLDSLRNESYGRISVGAKLDLPTRVTALLAPTVFKASIYLGVIGLVLYVVYKMLLGGGLNLSDLSKRLDAAVQAAKLPAAKGA